MEQYIGLILDENNVIETWCVPADMSEIKANLDTSLIICGLTKFVSGQLVNPSEGEIKAWKQAQIDNRAKKERVAELKKLLYDSDYKAIKFAEGELTAEEYEPFKAQRKAWREEINSLEN